MLVNAPLKLSRVSAPSNVEIKQSRRAAALRAASAALSASGGTSASRSSMCLMADSARSGLG